MAYLYRGCCYLPSLAGLNQIIFCWAQSQWYPLYTIQLYLQYIILSSPFKPNYIWPYPLKDICKYPVRAGLTKLYIVLFDSIESIYGYIFVYPNYIWQGTHRLLNPVLSLPSLYYYFSIHLMPFLYLLLYPLIYFLHPSSFFLYFIYLQNFSLLSYPVLNLLSPSISLPLSYSIPFLV